MTSHSEQRARFEHWVKNTIPARWPNPHGDGSYYDAAGEYYNNALQLMWASWQAAEPRRAKYLRETPSNDQCDHCRASPLYNLGDCILVWVGEGDAYALMEEMP